MNINTKRTRGINARVIAFYLPQYHPTETNNKFYGEGFTEWTNVGKAKPLFRGHYQPKVPTDLGYYDLRYPEIKQQQANMAQEAGIEGFCYYHYWFGNGKQELETPFKQIIESGKPDFPFCLCWANQSWYAKFWNHENKQDKLIVQQLYDNEEGIEKHFYSLLDAFKDKRYIKVDGKLLFMIYRPLEYPDITFFMKKWQELARMNNLSGFYFTGQATNDKQAKRMVGMGLDGVNIVRKDDFLLLFKYNNPFTKFINKVKRFFGAAPYHYDYKKIYHTFIQPDGIEKEENIFPTLIPNWDHSPRSGKRGVIFDNSTPENFGFHLDECINVVKSKKEENRIVFLKSWNEWGEGNYVEPCLKYGKGYINTLKEKLLEKN